MTSKRFEDVVAGTLIDLVDENAPIRLRFCEDTTTVGMEEGAQIAREGAIISLAQ